MELITTISVGGRDELCVVVCSMRDDVRVGNGVSVCEGTLLHSTSQDSVVADCLQTAQSPQSLLCIGDRTADIAVEVEHDGIPAA